MGGVVYLYCIASEGTFMSSFLFSDVQVNEFFIFSEFISGFRINLTEIFNIFTLVFTV